MTRFSFLLATSAVALVVAAGVIRPPATGAADADAAACSAVGEWRDPKTGKTLEHADLIDDLADRDVVVLGERHAVPGIQRWQLHTVAALHAREPDMVLAFEAFPRSVQPALDRWVAGELDEKAFLRESRWDEVWGLGTGLYMPLFRFARMHRIPMVAMNVERALVSRVGREGWDAIPEDAREGLSDPAPVSDGYRRALGAVLEAKAERAAAHAEVQAEKSDAPEVGDEEMQRRMQFFVEAQSTWDRAFAEAIADARANKPRPLVVAIVGRGHAEHGYGVPHQLRDLDIDDVAVVLTHAAGDDCDRLAPDDDGAAVADAVFGLEDEPARKHGGGPRLGVMIESSGKGDDAAVRVASVVDGSVAESTGIQPGDLIVEAAGVRTTKTGELIAVVRRQAPGTWLPLSVRRDGDELALVAKFPAAP